MHDDKRAQHSATNGNKNSDGGSVLALVRRTEEKEKRKGPDTTEKGEKVAL
jgi:hypothetical protein